MTEEQTVPQWVKLKPGLSVRVAVPVSVLDGFEEDVEELAWCKATQKIVRRPAWYSVEHQRLALELGRLKDEFHTLSGN